MTQVEEMAIENAYLPNKNTYIFVLIVLSQIFSFY